jgi:hypothetical protein
VIVANPLAASAIPFELAFDDRFDNEPLSQASFMAWASAQAISMLPHAPGAKSS